MALQDINGNPLQAAPQPAAPDEPQPPQRVVTAFVVYQQPTGRWLATSDLGVPIVTGRKPSVDDILGGASNIVAEVTARKAADMAATTTIQTQLAMARQMQAQSLTPEEEAALATATGRPGG